MKRIYFPHKDEMKQKVCGNCKKPYNEGDRYCRYCGALMGKPEYIEVIPACVYGPPPINREHTCANCGYFWITRLMVDNERWCPKCGGPVSTYEDRH